MSRRCVGSRRSNAMECFNTNRGLAQYIDGAVSPDESRGIEKHLSDCGRCSQKVEDYRQMRTVLRGLPRFNPSLQLQTKLTVLASRERARRVSKITVAYQWKMWRERTFARAHGTFSR